MNIAVLGWGSLIWDLGVLTPHVTGEWAMRAGPALPMEFSRISPKRKMGLVVCLDPADGVLCPTHAIRSVRRDILAAAEDLATREIAPFERIGFVAGDQEQGRLPEVIRRVRDWCAEAGWDGAVWTDLEPNFAGYRGQAFTVPRGIDYLSTLSGESMEEAFRYIEEAPETTRTPLRDALDTVDWWRARRGV
ncbi:hypothetical protein FHS89_002710 [Rubricella aquisinus]|uniref:Uncharacterized protein n=1 Tax=Rubricella aquisinus TaxID=2028108 RepID=A0A840WZU0_9RHOB|nr:hypothetical protein [Rubricella aquisinus]MBB5516670.1 hypothetical protein [Rubricella aquisinus]